MESFRVLGSSASCFAHECRVLRQSQVICLQFTISGTFQMGCNVESVHGGDSQNLIFVPKP